MPPVADDILSRRRIARTAFEILVIRFFGEGAGFQGKILSRFPLFAGYTLTMVEKTDASRPFHRVRQNIPIYYAIFFSQYQDILSKLSINYTKSPCILSIEKRGGMVYNQIKQKEKG
ncbi:MAG: hypothetical protein HDT27_08165 [Subdoligranulum sp.]|nr:hypothetical protein [Subdoligranulum sp.]